MDIDNRKKGDMHMADIPLTEYMKLNKPPKGYPDWDTFFNANFDIVDGKLKEINTQMVNIANEFTTKTLNAEDKLDVSGYIVRPVPVSTNKEEIYEQGYQISTLCK